MDKKLKLLERACDRAEALQRNGCAPQKNLIIWGEALLGIAECLQGLYIQDKIQKLETAFSLDNNSHLASWCLGNAHVASRLVSPDYTLARTHFRMASRYFEKAVSLDPGNNKYVDSLEIPKEMTDVHESIDGRISIVLRQRDLCILGCSSALDISKGAPFCDMGRGNPKYANEEYRRCSPTIRELLDNDLPNDGGKPQAGSSPILSHK